MDNSQENLPTGWERLNQLGGPKWYIPANYVPPVYVDAYSALFRLENSLRLLVYLVLKGLHGAEWDSVTLSHRKKEETIRTNFEKQSAKLRKYAHIGAVSLSPMMYLDLTTLIDLVCANWSSFCNVFKMDCESLRFRLDGLRLIRNNLAHFRDVTESDWQNVLMPYLELLVPNIDCYLKDLLPGEEADYEPVTTLGHEEASQYAPLLELTYPPVSFHAYVAGTGRWVRVSMNAELKVSKPSWKDGNWVVPYYRPNYGAIWDGLGRAAADAVAAYQGYTDLRPCVGQNGKPNGLDKPALMIFYLQLSRPPESRAAFLASLLKTAQDIKHEFMSAALTDSDHYRYLRKDTATIKKVGQGSVPDHLLWSPGPRPELSEPRETVENWTTSIPVFQGVQHQIAFPWIETKVQCIFAPWQWGQGDRH